MGAEQSHLEELKDQPDFRQDYISFFVNGREYNVRTNGCDPDIGPQYLLVDYLRDKLGLTGTKYMCRAGGCGACMVTLRSTNPASGQENLRSANSCLIPLFACDGLEITTIEHLGNRRTGYHPIQDRLVKFGGTQCGFCTPGFVMNMYSVVQNKPNFTHGDVEYSFDGNICRCTGYRSIIEGFKSLSPKTSEELKRKCQDIEDCHKCPLATLNKDAFFEDSSLEIVHTPRKLYLKSGNGEQWFKVTNLKTMFDVLQKFAYSQMRYRLIAGNTGMGVFRDDGPFQGFIEITDVPELHSASVDQTGLVLGGGTTLTAAIDQFAALRDTEGFVYASEFYKHFRRIACLSVRNQGTLAGNLMLKHTHREFVSDVFILFESVGATVRIGSSPTLFQSYTLVDFLELDMHGKVIVSIHFPVYKSSYVYRGIKIGKRYQNAQSYVFGAFLFNIDTSRNFTVVDHPTICYGGISPNFIHAHETESYLSGKQLTVSTLQSALGILAHEASPNFTPAHGTQEYRQNLAKAYLYKFVLKVRANSVAAKLKSGGEDVERALNVATQTFESDSSKWPLYQPIPKIESYPQTSGEAEYINDIRAELNELFGVFVVTRVANATVKSVDASRALMLPGVVAFITANDIPGNNNHAIFLNQPEEIFVSHHVQYAGQPVGLLVARDKYTAFDARDRIIVNYDNIKQPTLDIQASIHKSSVNDCYTDQNNNSDLAFPCRGIDSNVAKRIMDTVRTNRENSSSKVSDGNITIKGELNTSRQYHFHMETQICICTPTEDGMDVYSSTQHMDGVQAAIAACLNVPSSRINVHVRRLGGAFGAKISKAAHIATACAVAAYVTHKPVRIALDLETNMHMIGKRLPYFVKYEVEVDAVGKIHRLESEMFCDGGAVANEPTSLYGMICSQSCYRAEGWNVLPQVAVTDTSPNTYCRSPGSSQGVAAIETIMEHISFVVKKDPLEVRKTNFIRKGDPFIGIPGAKLPLDNLLPKMIKELMETSDYVSRKRFVETFNQTNRWKKRGISLVPQRYPNYYPSLAFPTFISVQHVDGSVNISHGGIEMGQGINTKVAQVVAHTLQIPIDKISIKPSNTTVSPNTGITGASVSSELVCSSARRACEQLLTKLAPVREALGNPTWEQLIAAANSREMLLTSQFQETQGDLVSYDIWGAIAIEIEMDVLTGDYKIIRTDVIEDAGDSLSPLVDIGQIEGGLIMGLGWWLTEELVYDPSNGLLLTDNTWNYKPMLPADIPEDIRVTLLRNAPNPFGVLSSKATGEPPFNMSVCVIFALRNAIDSARKDVGNNEWYQMDGPVTREVIRRLALASPEQYTF